MNVMIIKKMNLKRKHVIKTNNIMEEFLMKNQIGDKFSVAINDKIYNVNIDVDEMNINYNYIEINGYKLTIASVLYDNEDNDFYTKKYCAGIAYCSPKDEFIKSIGRKIANDKLIDNLAMGYDYILSPVEARKCFLKNELLYMYMVIDSVKNRLPHKLHMLDKYILGTSLLELAALRQERKNK